MKKDKTPIQILGVEFEALSEERLYCRIGSYLKGNITRSIFTPNPEILFNATKDARLMQSLKIGDLLLPDGIGVKLAARFLGHKDLQRATGIDTAETILKQAAELGASVYLLGGAEGVAEAAAKKLSEHIPDLKICGTHHGYFDKERDSLENIAVAEEIRQSGASVLFVCFGSPAQELWIRENSPAIPTVRIMMGLGGALDVWSEKKKRAPRAMRVLGLEWLYRIFSEPKRLLRLPALFGFCLATTRQVLYSKYEKGYSSATPSE